MYHNWSQCVNYQIESIKLFQAPRIFLEINDASVFKDVLGLGKRIHLKVVTGKKASKKAANSKDDFVYVDKKSLLYFNENGRESGWGVGGLFAKLRDAPDLTAERLEFILGKSLIHLLR